MRYDHNLPYDDFCGISAQMTDEIITWSTFAFAHGSNANFHCWGVYTAVAETPWMQTGNDIHIQGLKTVGGGSTFGEKKHRKVHVKQFITILML